jgi:hypothetical protein
MRQRLLSEILWFVPAVARLRGIRRIALLGSITTEKREPKDIDFLVVVDDEVSLEPLAKIGRKVKGHAQNIGRGADIFLADPGGRYIGRTCLWIECGPGIRRSCDALHCGRRHYLHDDMEAVTLSDEKIRMAIELWPVVERRKGLPDDLEKVLEQLRALSVEHQE